MSFSAGSRLGPYEILGQIGAGGMGEVYRARDPRLSREVAIKVLPASFSQDPDRLRRFEQEAKAAGVLNHPNITAVHDIGSHEGAPYIVTELLEGETLRAALSSGKLPPRKAIDYALQIAHGLAAAHDKGIVHRDLKPENVFVTNEGRVKILDFGLAKLTQAEAPVSSATNLPTETKGTEPGVVLGTLGYMSPEQVRGKSAGARSDIFAFGAILYEMLSGKRAFQGDSAADTMSAILKEDPPDLSVTNQAINPSLERVVRHCLEKNPEQRFHSAHDLAFDLEALSGTSGTGAAASVSAGRASKRRSPAVALAFAVVVLGALGLGYFWGTRRQVPTPSFQQLTFRRGTVLKARFAPDGQTVVYGAAWEGKPVEVFSARIGSPESRPFGIPGANLLAVSSTGELALALGWRYVSNWEASATLARVPLSGGAPKELIEDVQDADWSPDGRDLAVVRRVGDKRVLEYPIGRTLYETTGWLSRPRVAPDGKSIALLEHPVRGDNIARIVLVPATGKPRILTPVGAIGGVTWSADGARLWATENQELFRIATNGRRETMVRIPVNGIVEDVSRDGRLLLSLIPYRREIIGLAPGDTRERNLTWLNWSYPCDLSKDGSQLLFEEQNLGPENAIYIRKIDGSEAIRLGTGRVLALSPDGRWALAAPKSTDQLILIPTGPGQTRTLPKTKVTYFPNANFLPDGSGFVVAGREPGHGNRLFVQDFDGAPRPISPEGVTFGRWKAVSPDGKRIAALGPNRRITLYPMDSGEPVPVPGVEPDELPIGWTADGQSLYVAPSFGVPARIHLVEVATGRRTLWRIFDAPDPAGILRMGPNFIAEDGRSYVYSYRREVGDLFLVEGLR